MEPVRFSNSSDEAADLLEAFLQPRKEARRTLSDSASRRLLRLARRLARDLPDDLLGEVVNETWLLLLSSSARFDRTRGTAAGFIALYMKNALRLVRARYAPPGVGKRDASRRRAGRLTKPVVEDADEVLASLPDPAAWARVEARAEANRMLGRAGPRLRHGLWLVKVEGRSLADAAERLGTSRFKLARAFDRFVQIQVAA